MGGCRCSYKNCTLKTDGVTHMFHYPVFDKVRCHQWLTNAQKLEFLNLKVSQLKNRVVCQHHFTNDNFMNFLKDKLTFDAVPTEDGPYCDTSQLNDKRPVEEESKLYSISLEDIENEYLTINDKKANFSVKYGDFLTNCDLMDLDAINQGNDDNTQIMIKNKDFVETNDVILNENFDHKGIGSLNSALTKNIDAGAPPNKNYITIEISEMPVIVEGAQNNLILPNAAGMCPAPSVSQEAVQVNNIKVLTHKPKQAKNNSKSLLKEKKKITILDEQKISEPLSVTFPVKLEPVCPSALLPIPINKRRSNQNSRNTDTNSVTKHNNSAKIVAPDTVENPIIAEQPTSTEVVINNIKSNIPDSIINLGNIDHANNNKKQVHGNFPRAAVQKANNVFSHNENTRKTTKSFNKNRIPPERMAAIEEKRKFNMKLRDIIASCLDKMDEDENKDCDNSKVKSNRGKNITNNVSSYLSKEPELPSFQDYTVAYLEARMKKMEDILLNKIDQNSQRILELKQLVSPLPDKKAACTQTAINEEQQKKHLYQEISKYLSPEANSLLYEELFINKYVQNIPKCSPTKKRKYR